MTSIGTNGFYQRSIEGLASLRRKTEAMQTQLATGQRLSRASDDPAAAARLAILGRADARAAIDTTNANRATADLTLADQTIATIADQAARVRELATEASTGILSNQQRASIAAELNQLHSGFMALANTRNSTGQALFGGSGSGDAYSLDAGGNAVYGGTAQAGELSIGEGLSVRRGLTGPEVFGTGSKDLLATIKTLADAMGGGATDPATAAKDMLGALADGIDTISTGQTVVGARLAWIDLTTAQAQDRGEVRAEEQAAIGGTDLTRTIAELQQMSLVLEASQASFVRLSGLSLFNLLN